MMRWANPAPPLKNGVSRESLHQGRESMISGSRLVYSLQPELDIFE